MSLDYRESQSSEAAGNSKCKQRYFIYSQSISLIVKVFQVKTNISDIDNISHINTISTKEQSEKSHTLKENVELILLAVAEPGDELEWARGQVIRLATPSTVLPTTTLPQKLINFYFYFS